MGRWELEVKAVSFDLRNSWFVICDSCFLFAQLLIISWQFFFTSGNLCDSIVINTQIYNSFLINRYDSWLMIPLPAPSNDTKVEQKWLEIEKINIFSSLEKLRTVRLLKTHKCLTNILDKTKVNYKMFREMHAPWLIRKTSLYFHKVCALRHTSALLRYNAHSLRHRYERAQFTIHFIKEIRELVPRALLSYIST